MKKRRLTNALGLLVLAAALGACKESPPAPEAATASPTPVAQAGAVEQPAATPAAQESVTPTPLPTPTPTPPPAAEVRAAIERVYKGAVSPETGAGAFVVGDFNGDGSEDLVVRVRAAPGRLEELNDDLANWIVSDPRKVLRPDPRKFDPHQNVQKLTPVAERPKVSAADSLLVVLHGYKDAGWRGREASQTYLLVDAGGADLRPQLRGEARFANIGKNPPRLMGDVIRETLRGEQGFLYWNGATYGWFSPGSDK